MTDIIRKATIVLGLETGDVKIEIPDLEPVLKSREKEAELIEKIAKAEKEFREAEQGRIKATTDLADKKAKAVKGITDDIEKLDREFGEKFDAFEKGLNKVIEEEKALVDNTLSTANQFLGATQQMGEGAFLLARSVALLSADSEEDLQKMLKNLALVQGAFDLFKGSAQVIQGVIANMQALRAASAAVLTTLGPLGIAFVALSAATAGIAFAFRDSSEAIEDESEALKRNMRTKEEAQKASEELAAKQLETQRKLRDAVKRIEGLDQGRITFERELEEALTAVSAADQAPFRGDRERLGNLAVLEAADAFEASRSRIGEIQGLLGGDGASRVGGRDRANLEAELASIESSIGRLADAIADNFGRVIRSMEESQVGVLNQ